MQGDILPLTHRVDKRQNAEVLPILLQIRALCADWTDGVEPLENYKALRRKAGTPKADHRGRLVALSATQLALLRCYVRGLCHEDTGRRMRKGIFSLGRKTDLEEHDLQVCMYVCMSRYMYRYIDRYIDRYMCIDRYIDK